MNRAISSFLVVVAALVAVMSVVLDRQDGSAGQAAQPESSGTKGWKQGVGWGWIWCKEDQRGALNAMSDATRREALSLAKTGRTYDLGVTYSRNSFKWPGHSPGEIMTFRSPEGVKRQQDIPVVKPDVNPAGVGWHSCALFINDNVATQIDGLAHITMGNDNHWYNGFTEAQAGGDFGVRRCDVTNIQPIIARGVMLDVAGAKKLEVLPSSYTITPSDIERCLSVQKTQLRPGDVVLLRTGTLRYWGTDGADHEKIKEHDSAGINLAAAKHLVERYGAMMIGSDTSGLEVNPAEKGSDSFVPVHTYLLVEQGVHIGEFHNLEDLARDKVYEFCYVATTNKIAGSVAGFALRPLAMR